MPLNVGHISTPSHAAAPDPQTSEHNLSHVMHFETGGPWFRDADKIDDPIH
jgi:hypothetical protein